MSGSLWGDSWAPSVSSGATCGTGGWTGPKPGDPDNNAILSAKPAFGGVDVSWTYPTTNPEAVAHTLLYRSTSSVFETAIQIAVVAGNFFYDKNTTTSVVTYYYWIKIVSVYGTIGQLIGPAAATARPTVEDTIEQLTGKIDAGVLATALRSEIDNITTVGADLLKEIRERLAAEAIMSGALGEVQNGIALAMTYITEEITERVEGDSALVNKLNIMAAAVDKNLAAILTEQTVRVDADSAMAKRVDLITTNVNANSAAILTEQTTRASETNALASNFLTINSIVNGNTATGQVGLTTKVTTIDGKVTEIGALYTAKVQVNGLIGGFGIYNDGTTVEAGFDVDRFWIGRTNANKRKPFIIENGVVYIDDAAINKLTISKLRSEDNSFAFQNGKLRADLLEVTQITNGAFNSYTWPAAGQQGFFLGPGGLLLGNYNNLPGQPKKYIQLTGEGDLYAPGINIVNGTLTIDKIDVIDTLNIKGNAVTVPLYGGLTWNLDSGTTYKPNSYTTYQYLRAGTGIIVLCTFSVHRPGFHGAAVNLRVFNGAYPVSIGGVGFSYENNGAGTASGYYTVPSDGYYRVEAWVYASSGDGPVNEVTSCSISAFGAKR